MPFETLVLFALSALVAAAVVAMFAILGKGRAGTTGAQAKLDAGQYQAVLEATRTDPGVGREERLAAAIAAKHLLDLKLARRLLDQIVAEDIDDGEAWLELGLVEAYDGRYAEAARAFDRVAGSRSDLLESLTLHRAWLASLEGDDLSARRFFGEIEVPLETKLRQDIGEGDAAFAEWFLQAGLLWRRHDDQERADWALMAARQAAPQSRLVAELAGDDK